MEPAGARRVAASGTADSATVSLRQQSRKYGTCKCNFPPLHKRRDKSGAASHRSLIAMKLFDVLLANGSRQISVPLFHCSSSNIHPALWLSDNFLLLIRQETGPVCQHTPGKHVYTANNARLLLTAPPGMFPQISHVSVQTKRRQVE